MLGKRKNGNLCSNGRTAVIPDKMSVAFYTNEGDGREGVFMEVDGTEGERLVLIFTRDQFQKTITHLMHAMSGDNVDKDVTF